MDNIKLVALNISLLKVPKSCFKKGNNNMLYTTTPAGLDLTQQIIFQSHHFSNSIFEAKVKNL